MILQHFHGFKDGSDATCAGVEQDANNDGIIDLLETRPVSGVTLVPFHDDPASLKIKTHTYPKADAEGRIMYVKTVSTSALESAMQQKYGISEMEWEKRVIYLHGVPEDTELPESVQSLPDVPAHITLPVSCGPIQRISGSSPMD